MPSGLYRFLDDDGNDPGTEQFRCAPGPMGWRYFSTVQDSRGTTNVDLSVDAAWHPVRVRIQTPDHHLLITAQGALLDEQPSPATLGQVMFYPSPGFLVAAVRALGETAEVDAIALDEDLGTSAERQRYELIGEDDIATPVGMFAARAWRFISPRPRFSRTVWVARDVAVASEGWFELLAYEPGGTGPAARA